MPNTNFLHKIYPKMGLFNAEMLRAVGPAYFNSFLPLAMLTENIMDDYFIENIKPRPGSKIFPEGNVSDYKAFISETWSALQEKHSLRLNGRLSINIREFEQVFDDINHCFDSC